MILLDTTVLVYAVGGEHPLAGPARSLITRIEQGEIRAHTTPEVIEEFARIRAQRRSRQDAQHLARAYAALLAPLQLLGANHLETGLDIWVNAPSLGSFDAVLAATAISLDAELVSADRGFAEGSELKWRDLADVILLRGE